MRILRTPETAFEQLEGFDYIPRFLTISDEATGAPLRIHYVDEGPREAQPVLMLHGEPTWCYLYRHMIPGIVANGLRAVAPDLVGFGRSDKPAARQDYSYARQVAWMRAWLERLDLTNIVLVCQDWGSLIGLRLLAEMPDRFASVVLSNGGLPAGQTGPRAFRIWRAFSRFSPFFPIGKIVQAGTRRRLSAAEIAAYDAPFPSSAHKAAARVFPSLVPLGDNEAVPDQLKAWAVLDRWEKPFLCCFSHADPVTRGGERLFIARVPGTRDQPHSTLRGGHFIQEDDPDGFVAAIMKVTQQ
ncbi:haloalkane dehalogenase [Candidatus Phycosocius bacilliformis]|uniref:Haloalkane dehalogenase n=1 Tax=Candidatus Phycosocius bacilliformis TaxID=1445552 RepID=A0A2P2EE48_9PROT|nr:haloalkane dehalogenase [Candidatus Phycosocius bacilliformis]GBF59342.1 haloalkane dehalogenase [Candidatus Phycosocius bacilliformis]